MVNNKDRGLIDKTKKWEAGKVSERRYDAARGQRYGGRNFVTRGINRTLRAGAHPNTVIGKQVDRDARVLSLIQENADTIEARHEGAKSMSKDERAIHALVSDESEASAQIESLAAQRAKDQGRVGDVDFMDQERAKLKMAYETGKKKMGGSVDTASQLYNLKKAAAEGSITPEQAEIAATRLAGKLATGGRQQEQLARTLHQELDSSVAAAGFVPGSVTAARTARVGAGTGAPAPTIDHETVNKIYSGPSTYSTEQLVNLKSDAAETVMNSKTQQASSALSIIQSPTATADDVIKATDELVKHRADLLVTQSAAAKAGKQGLVDQTRKALTDIDTIVTAAESAAPGHLAGLTTHITDESHQQATDRVKPI